ncbi:MAG: hypothetical protein AAGI34_19095 [Pseudomonadota bacterium]
MPRPVPPKQRAVLAAGEALPPPSDPRAAQETLAAAARRQARARPPAPTEAAPAEAIEAFCRHLGQGLDVIARRLAEGGAGAVLQRRGQEDEAALPMPVEAVIAVIGGVETTVALRLSASPAHARRLIETAPSHTIRHDKLVQIEGRILRDCLSCGQTYHAEEDYRLCPTCRKRAGGVSHDRAEPRGPCDGRA